MLLLLLSSLSLLLTITIIHIPQLFNKCCLTIIYIFLKKLAKICNSKNLIFLLTYYWFVF